MLNQNLKALPPISRPSTKGIELTQTSIKPSLGIIDQPMSILSLDYRTNPKQLSFEHHLLERLALLVYTNIIEVLSKHNEISPDHDKLVQVMSMGLSRQAIGIDKARYVYDCDCGLGKTTTLIALIRAIDQLNLPISLLVASAQIEPNCNIISSLS